MTIIADPSAPGAKKSWNEGDYMWDETKAAAVRHAAKSPASESPAPTGFEDIRRQRNAWYSKLGDRRLVCRVEGCDATCSSAYSGRSRICKACQTAREVRWRGENARFCQKCTAFHPLSAFNGKNRTCQKWLERVRVAAESRAKARRAKSGSPDDGGASSSSSSKKPATSGEPSRSRDENPFPGRPVPPPDVHHELAEFASRTFAAVFQTDASDAAEDPNRVDREEGPGPVPRDPGPFPPGVLRARSSGPSSAFPLQTYGSSSALPGDLPAPPLAADVALPADAFFEESDVSFASVWLKLENTTPDDLPPEGLEPFLRDAARATPLAMSSCAQPGCTLVKFDFVLRAQDAKRAIEPVFAHPTPAVLVLESFFGDGIGGADVPGFLANGAVSAGVCGRPDAAEATLGEPGRVRGFLPKVVRDVGFGAEEDTLAFALGARVESDLCKVARFFGGAGLPRFSGGRVEVRVSFPCALLAKVLDGSVSFEVRARGCVFRADVVGTPSGGAEPSGFAEAALSFPTRAPGSPANRGEPLQGAAVVDAVCTATRASVGIAPAVFVFVRDRETKAFVDALLEPRESSSSVRDARCRAAERSALFALGAALAGHSAAARGVARRAFRASRAASGRGRACAALVDELFANSALRGRDDAEAVLADAARLAPARVVAAVAAVVERRSIDEASETDPLDEASETDPLDEARGTATADDSGRLALRVAATRGDPGVALRLLSGGVAKPSHWFERRGATTPRVLADARMSRAVESRVFESAALAAETLRRSAEEEGVSVRAEVGGGRDEPRASSFRANRADAVLSRAISRVSRLADEEDARAERASKTSGSGTFNPGDPGESVSGGSEACRGLAASTSSRTSPDETRDSVSPEGCLWRLALATLADPEFAPALVSAFARGGGSPEDAAESYWDPEAASWRASLDALLAGARDRAAVGEDVSGLAEAAESLLVEIERVAKSTASRGGAAGGFASRLRHAAACVVPDGDATWFSWEHGPGGDARSYDELDVRRALSLGGVVTPATQTRLLLSGAILCTCHACLSGGWGGKTVGGAVAWAGLLIARATTDPDAPWPKVPSLLALCYYFCPAIVVGVGFVATRLYPEGWARRRETMIMTCRLVNTFGWVVTHSSGVLLLDEATMWKSSLVRVFWMSVILASTSIRLERQLFVSAAQFLVFLKMDLAKFRGSATRVVTRTLIEVLFVGSAVAYGAWRERVVRRHLARKRK